MFDSKARTSLITSLLGLAVLGLSPAAFADSGLYIGGNVGTATVAVDLADPVDPGFADIDFDEDDFAWKVYGGYVFDLSAVNLGLELGYFDLGAPSVDVAAESLEVGVTGISAFALLGVDIGPVGIFIKGGMASWDAELALADLEAAEDGSDPAYGIGLQFVFTSLEIRAEYEVFDIEDADDVTMASVGLAWRF